MDEESAAPRSDARDWESDRVSTRDGVVIPVRATARRPDWSQLPRGVCEHIELRAGGTVASSRSAGTGFTPGFASRLELSDGTRLFVKAASSADDRLHGWPLSDNYRDEVRKLSLLPAGIGAPTLLWHDDVVLDEERWILLAFEYVEAAPPRRPWRHDQLILVLDKLTEVAEPLRVVPAGLRLDTIGVELLTATDERLDIVRGRDGDSPWLRTVTRLCGDAGSLIAGGSIVHMDLRDDNVLIGSQGQVWFVDWNWPVLGVDWVDTICILLSAHGDGIDADELIRSQPLTRDVDPHAIDAFLAVLWTYWAVTRHHDVPTSSPHIRDHQTWYADVTGDWLMKRLSQR